MTASPQVEITGAELKGPELWVFNTLVRLADGEDVASVSFDALVAASAKRGDLSAREIKAALESLQTRRYVASRKLFGLGTNGDLLLANRRSDDAARERELQSAAEAAGR